MSLERTISAMQYARVAAARPHGPCDMGRPGGEYRPPAARSRAFAHLTHWRSPSDRSPAMGTASPARALGALLPLLLLLACGIAMPLAAGEPSRCSACRAVAVRSGGGGSGGGGSGGRALLAAAPAFVLLLGIAGQLLGLHYLATTCCTSLATGGLRMSCLGRFSRSNDCQRNARNRPTACRAPKRARFHCTWLSLYFLPL